jgi:uncharacterized phage protein gp47/JayE
MITPPDIKDIYNRFISRLKDEAGITAEGNDSIARAFGLGVADVADSLWQLLAKAERAYSLDTAVGQELDSIGDFLGVPRKPAVRATTVGYGPAVVFRNTGGTVQNVPRGTAVFPYGQPSIVFRTLQTIDVPAFGTLAVDVETSNVGSIYNVAAGVLNSHNQGSTALLVTNPRAIDSGSDRESDESYRARLFQARKLKNPGSKTAIRLNLASLPGVRDVLLLENTGGAGTFDVILIGQTTTIPNESITEAQNYLAEFAPIGISYRVLLPKEVNIDVTVRLFLNAGQEIEKPALIARVGQAVRGYIDSLSVEDGTGSGTFIYSDLIELVGGAAAIARDYSIDVYIDNAPIIFGSNYTLQIGERLSSRRVRVE